MRIQPYSMLRNCIVTTLVLASSVSAKPTFEPTNAFTGINPKELASLIIQAHEKAGFTPLSKPSAESLQQLEFQYTIPAADQVPSLTAQYSAQLFVRQLDSQGRCDTCVLHSGAVQKIDVNNLNEKQRRTLNEAISASSRNLEKPTQHYLKNPSFIPYRLQIPFELPPGAVT